MPSASVRAVFLRILLFLPGSIDAAVKIFGSLAKIEDADYSKMRARFSLRETLVKPR